MTKPKKNKGPKILYWDTETAPMILASFGLWDQNHQYNQVYQDWFFICAQWCWEHDKRTQFVSLLDDPKRFKKDHTDDFFIVKTIYDLISEADIIVAHNNDGFDWKKFMAKVVEHKLPPIKIPYMVDTLKQARNHGFTSNKLEDLNIKLGLKRKLQTERGLWPRAAQGDKDAIMKILKYGKGDIPSLRELYLRLRPYMKAHPNFNHFSDGKDCCPNCGSTHFQSRGTRTSMTSIYKQFQCQTCKHWFKGKSPIGKVNMR